MQTLRFSSAAVSSRTPLSSLGYCCRNAYLADKTVCMFCGKALPVGRQPSEAELAAIRERQLQEEFNSRPALPRRSGKSDFDSQVLSYLVTQKNGARITHIDIAAACSITRKMSVSCCERLCRRGFLAVIGQHRIKSKRYMSIYAWLGDPPNQSLAESMANQAEFAVTED